MTGSNGASPNDAVMLGKMIEDGLMTALLTKAFEELAKLSDERQDELAKMLIDVAERDRLLAEGASSLTAEQMAEVHEALAEDGPYATDEEMEAFFSRYRA